MVVVEFIISMTRSMIMKRNLMTTSLPCIYIIEQNLGDVLLHEGGYGDGHSTDGYGDGEGEGGYPIAYYTHHYGDGGIARTMQGFVNGDGETWNYINEGM
jgi:hypothetical protein